MTNQEFERVLAAGFAGGAPTTSEQEMLSQCLADAFGVSDLRFLDYGFHTAVFTDKETAYAATGWPAGFDNAKTARALMPKHRPPEILEIRYIGNHAAVKMELIKGQTMSTREPDEKTGQQLADYLELLLSVPQAESTGWGPDQNHVTVLDVLTNDSIWSCPCPTLVCQKADKTSLIAAAEKIVTEHDFSWCEADKAWIHGDIHFENVMASRDGLRIIDWSHLAVLPALYEFVALQRQARWISGTRPELINHGLLAALAMEEAIPKLSKKYNGIDFIEKLNVGCVANMLGEVSEEAHCGTPTSERTQHGFKLALEAYEAGVLMTQLATQQTSKPS